jgi:hypothetical protein
MSDFFPTQTSKLVNWIMAFVKGVQKHKGVLNVSDVHTQELNDAYINLADADRDVMEAKHSYQAAIKKRNENKKHAIRVIRMLSGIFQASPTVTGDVLKELGLKPHKKKRSFDSPITPTGLFVTPVTKDVNLVKWNGNGNKRHTLFVVEVKYQDEDQFHVVWAGMSTRMEHTAKSSYAQAYYRVCSKRRKIKSNYSDIAGVYLV